MFGSTSLAFCCCRSWSRFAGGRMMAASTTTSPKGDLPNSGKTRSAEPKLPPTGKGERTALPCPTRARVLAGPMPRTTAALLGLDSVHRTTQPARPQAPSTDAWVAAPC